MHWIHIGIMEEIKIDMDKFLEVEIKTKHVWYVQTTNMTDFNELDDDILIFEIILWYYIHCCIRKFQKFQN